MPFRNSLIALAITAALAPTALAQNATLKAPIAASAPTAVPALIPYSGTVADSKTAETTITFLIYKDEAGGEPLFTESQAVATDAAGHYKVQLGTSLPSGLPADLFSTGEARWLEVQVAGEKPQPRVLLASVPYALKAADAATLGGLPASAFALAGTPSISAVAAAQGITPDANATVTTPGGTSGYVPVFTGTATIADSILFQTTTGIGIGTQNPAATLDVDGKAVLRGNVDLARNGNASTKAGANSNLFQFSAQALNNNGADVNLTYQLQAEPTGNNSASPAATFNLLYSNGTTGGETGFYFNPSGTIHFASGQTFPGTGPGTITGVTAGTDLTGGGTAGNVTLKLDTTKVPTLAGNNTFTGSNVFAPSLYTDTDMNIDNNNSNAGGISPGLRFGGASGEGLASQRASGGDNQYGLDFFTDYTRRISISEAGYIGIGTASREGTMLYVSGGSYAGEFSNTEEDFPALFAQNLYTGGTALVFETYGQGGVCDIDTNSNLSCEGNINGNDLARKVDDPLDPANKYLVHTSVQSSEMMNIYSGNVTTDELGVATISLPSWFEAENGDFRYQLTTIGRDAHAWVSQEVANGQFKIATNATNVKVSWQITAVRQDSYAKAHPLVAEQAKPANERGLYQHPELFGQPKEKGIAWSHKPEQMKKSKAQRTAASLQPTVR
jgi:hypothetical protein